MWDSLHNRNFFLEVGQNSEISFFPPVHWSVQISYHFLELIMIVYVLLEICSFSLDFQSCWQSCCNFLIIISMFYLSGYISFFILNIYFNLCSLKKFRLLKRSGLSYRSVGFGLICPFSFVCVCLWGVRGEVGGLCGGGSFYFF